MDMQVIRNQMDEVDEKMLALFLQRMALAEETAAYKKEHALPILDRAREREILARVQELAGEREEYAYYFFSKLMDLSKARQSELLQGGTKVRKMVESALLPAGETFPRTGTVACQGVEGSNSQMACDKLLPRGSILYVKTFRAVFDAVRAGLCTYGVVPIENSINGSIRQNYELLQEHDFSIVRATALNIHHELLAKKGAKLSDITEIVSHEQALGQCGRFLTSLGNGIRVTSCANTAMAAKAVADCGDNHMAAIASDPCAALYGLDVLRGEIQDNDNNYTKFVCISKKPTIYAGANRISLSFACGNEPGDLGSILAAFSSRGINLIKLESCPVAGRSFEFVFYVELEAGVNEPGVLPMLEELERRCSSFTLLGNYAMA